MRQGEKLNVEDMVREDMLERGGFAVKMDCRGRLETPD